MALGRWTFPTSRKQSTASSGTNRTTNGSTTPTDSETQESTKSPSRILKTFTGGFISHKSKKSVDRDELAHLNRPFNQQNLEHQKILNAFEWNFGRRKTSHSGRSIASGISPSTSRNNSVDRGHSSHYDPTEPHPRFDSSLARQPTREDPREESEK
ncbi:uncharacterized protein GGS22DRAFT_109931 [Annulohypoxylon maeteangense]|uniref:uncharacterized protein n=1 Tax=Annulohypoxylon maeteangense TaxID=1927788 RepID=UPI002007C403|nr:uncharacterized protein GGS22DRAFT_109931 [Annulohypoxylon maeteangense]KAI0887482.1 hypothetical protein GGS22DRAFT_109931 [Annulohypoxylon maeteangense]